MMSNLLYEDIVHKIEELIKTDDYQEGKKIPSERELAEQFGVSRNVVREAIGVLRAKGLLVIKQGKGAYVSKPQDHIVTESLHRVLGTHHTTIEDILEVRAELEISIIKKAVLKAMPQDVHNLKDIYMQMEDHKQEFQRQQFTHYDEQFHLALANCTQNKTFTVLMYAFFELTERAPFVITHLTPSNVSTAQGHHLALIQAIESKNEQAAVSNIQAHIQLLKDAAEYLKKNDLI